MHIPAETFAHDRVQVLMQPPKQNPTTAILNVSSMRLVLTSFIKEFGAIMCDPSFKWY